MVRTSEVQQVTRPSLYSSTSASHSAVDAAPGAVGVGVGREKDDSSQVPTLYYPTQAGPASVPPLLLLLFPLLLLILAAAVVHPPACSSSDSSNAYALS